MATHYFRDTSAAGICLAMEEDSYLYDEKTGGLYVAICVRCKKDPLDHVNGKCLFSADKLKLGKQFPVGQEDRRYVRVAKPPEEVMLYAVHRTRTKRGDYEWTMTPR